MWDNIAEWHLVLPPSRPDVPELRRIATLARQIKKDEPVAVLGSTPEFRDALCQLGFKNVFVFDKSLAFHIQMDKMRAFHNRENFVHGDWLSTLRNFDRQFSLVLSDLTLGNIAYDDRSSFYELVYSSLANGGWFVDKVLINQRPLLRLKEIERKYRHFPVNLLSANYFSCDAIFCSEFQLNLGVIDSTAIYTELQRTLVGARFEALQGLAKRITPPNCVWFYGRPWAEVSQTYCRWLVERRSFDMLRHVPYHGRARQIFWQRG